MEQLRFQGGAVKLALSEMAGDRVRYLVVIQQPTNAAHLVHNIGTFLTNAASGLSHFVSSI